MTTKSQTQTQPSVLRHFLPILTWLPQYQSAWLRTDLIAGLTIVALLVPEGMAYAQIAGVPPETAFYAAPIGLLLFADLRHIAPVGGGRLRGYRHDVVCHGQPDRARRTRPSSSC